MKQVATVCVLAGLMVAYFAALHAIGPEARDGLYAFFFRDYVAYFDLHIASHLPAITHPVLIMLMAAIAGAVAPRALEISRWTAMVIVAYCATKLAFLASGAQGAMPPSLSLILAAIFALGWLFVLATIGDRTLILWLREHFRFEFGTRES